jgi:cytochrome c-type biogenesis protein CcmH/NrfG
VVFTYAQAAVDEPNAKIRQSLVASRVAIVLLSLASLWPVLICAFGGWDDDLNVTANPWLNPPSWRGVARYWRAPAADLYVPVTYTTWSFVAVVSPRDEIGRLSARGFHLVNLVAHVCAAICVFEILRRCARSARPPLDKLGTEPPAIAAAAIGALVFALHPVQVEPVAWVAGLKDVLAGALALGGIALFVCDERRTVARSGATTIAFALALLAKPSAVVGPVIALLVDVLVLRRALRRSVLSLLPSLALAAVIIFAARHAQPAGQVAAPPLWQRLFIAGDALTFYLGKLLWPVKLGVDYGRTPQSALSSPFIWTMWLIPAALVALAAWWAQRHRDALPLVAILAFIAGVGPVLGIVPFDFQAYSTVADHYLYLAMLGPAMVVMWLVARRPIRITWVFCSIAIVLLAALSFRQTWTWRDSLSIAQQAARVNPSSFAWHDRAAMSLFYDHHDPQRAIAAERDAVNANPNYGVGWQNLGLILASAGLHAEAADAYRHAVAIDPHNVQALIGLANALADLGDSAEAIQQYRATLQRDPNNVVALSNLAGVLASQGKLEEAIGLYRRAIAIDGTFQPARLGLTRAIDERVKRAAAPAQR